MTRVRNSVCVVMLWSAAVAGAAPPTTAPATRPGTPGYPSTAPTTAPVSDDRMRLMQQFAGLKRLSARPITQVVKFDLDDGFLRIRPVVRDNTGPVSVEATDWPGFLQLDTSRRTLVGRQGDFFTLEHTALTDEDRTMSITQIGVGPGYLQLSRDTESEADDSTISNIALIQFRRGNDEENPVRLNVQVGRKNAAKFTTTLRLSAPSFTDLLRQNPQAVREYLMPVLRDFGAASVLRLSDPAVAWQVLGDDVPVDPSTNARIDVLLSTLAGDDFAARVKAEEQLAALGPVAAAALRHRDLDKLPPDPRSAAQSAIRRSQPVTAERAQELGKSVAFLVDSLLQDDPRLVAVASARLSAITGRQPPDLPATLSPEDREKRVEAYRSSVPTTAPAAAAATQPAQP